jgi:hypothetical protein
MRGMSFSFERPTWVRRGKFEQEGQENGASH